MTLHRPPGLDGCRVLVVEDEYLLADDLQRELEEAGATVLGPVGEVEEAMALVGRILAGEGLAGEGLAGEGLAGGPDRLDLAVLDVNLHGTRVWPVADLLAEHGIPFLFATGYERAVIPPRHAGAASCTKPIEAGQVAAALAGLQGRPQRR